MFEDIETYHKRFFEQSLDELFDCNFYASDFRHEIFVYCIDELSQQVQQSQRKASFARATKFIEENKLTLLVSISKLMTCTKPTNNTQQVPTPISTPLTVKSAVLHPSKSQIQKVCSQYANALNAYYVLLKELDRNKSCEHGQLEKLFALFTETKQYEQDT